MNRVLFVAALLLSLGLLGCSRSESPEPETSERPEAQSEEGHEEEAHDEEGHVELTEAALELSAEKRRRTVWRVDAGVGSLRRVNWLLGRGYQIHLKDCSSKRAEAFAQTVSEWHRDPDNPERGFGWATGEKLDNPRHVRRLILRFAA